MAPSLLKAIAALGLAASLVEAAAPRVLPMKMNRRERTNSLSKRASDTLLVQLGNEYQIGLYYVNASVGTPGQQVSLQIDTGSSDFWMFGPNSCNATTSPCLGGTFNPANSKTVTELGKPGEFSIQYETPGSGVQGNYINDVAVLGGATIKNLTMAVATYAGYVPTGIMGIGFDDDESIVANGGQPYPNIIDVLVNDGIIGAHGYSLYLDNLEDSTGTVLFGGYDTDKYHGDLSVLQIQPDSQTGTISSMTVAWSGLTLTDSQGTQPVSASDFPIAAVLDSGTTLTVIPQDMFSALANYFNVQNDQTYGYLVACNISKVQGSLDYQFGGSGGPTISVGFSELAIPITGENGQPLTFQDGSDACSFGLDQTGAQEPVLLGDTFLRSAYVVYDLDQQQIGIAQTNFESTSSNVVELSSNGNLAGVSGVDSSVTVKQTATRQPGQSVINTAAGSGQLTVGTSPTGTAGGGLTGGIGGASAATPTSSPTTSKKSSASTLTPQFDVTGLVVLGSTALLMMTGGAFMIFI